MEVSTGAVSIRLRTRFITLPQWQPFHTEKPVLLNGTVIKDCEGNSSHPYLGKRVGKEGRVCSTTMVLMQANTGPSLTHTHPTPLKPGKQSCGHDPMLNSLKPNQESESMAKVVYRKFWKDYLSGLFKRKP